MENNASVEMPRYKCHKEVWALKIKDITINPNPEGLEFPLTLHPEEEGYAPFKVDRAYVDKHNPQIGGYYVVYRDGYKSFSSAQAFAEGYRIIEG